MFTIINDSNDYNNSYIVYFLLFYYKCLFKFSFKS